MRACVLTTVHVYNDNRIFFKQIPTLLQGGYQVTYIAPCPPEVSYLKGIDLIPLPQIPRSRRPLNWGRALGAALQSRADIFHFHDPELIGVGLLLKMLTSRPVVYDVHENYPQVMLSRRWIPAGLRRMAAAAIGAFEWLAVRFFDGIVVANPPTYVRFQGTRQGLVLVRNFVDLKTFENSRGSVSLNLELPYFVYSGLLSTDRGVLDCLAAFERLGRKDARLVLVGRVDDAEPSLADLPELTAPGVHFLRAQPFSHLASLLRGSCAGLVTLRSTPENLLVLPTKLLDYMAASVPVIAYDLPLVRPIVEDAGCGILVKPQDIEALAEAMAYVLDHPAEAKEMGKRGWQAVLQRYSWESEEKKLLDLYAELLRRKKLSSHSAQRGTG